MDRLSSAEKNNKKWFDGTAFQDSDADPEFTEIAANFLCGDVLARKGSLSDKQRALLILVHLTATQTVNALFKYTSAALKVGATPVEIKEAVYQTAPYIGLEKVQAALDEINFAFSEADIDTPTEPQTQADEEGRYPVGLKCQQMIFGEDNINSMRKNAPKDEKDIQDYLSAYCFGDFYTRSGLDIKMRELVTFTALASMGGVAPQMRAHIAGNLSVGNTREDLIDAVITILPFNGFPRTLNALALIDEAAPAE
ncbi:MAG: carboxymuconolactone decarboxylase family protein [Acutalibacteraceae bacterium]